MTNKNTRHNHVIKTLQELIFNSDFQSEQDKIEKGKLEEQLKNNKNIIDDIKKLMEKVDRIYIECKNPSPPNDFAIEPLIEIMKKRAKNLVALGDLKINRETGIIKNFDKAFIDFINFDTFGNVDIDKIKKMEKDKIEKLIKYLEQLKKTEEETDKRNAVIYHLTSEQIDVEVSWVHKSMTNLAKLGQGLWTAGKFVAAAPGMPLVMLGKALEKGWEGASGLAGHAWRGKRYKCTDKISFMGVKKMKVSDAIEKILEANLQNLKNTHNIDNVTFKKFFKDEDKFIKMCDILKNKYVLRKSYRTGQLSFASGEIQKGLTEIYKKKIDEENKIKNKQKKRLIIYIQPREDDDIGNMITMCEGIKETIDRLSDSESISRAIKSDENETRDKWDKSTLEQKANMDMADVRKAKKLVKKQAKLDKAEAKNQAKLKKKAEKEKKEEAKKAEKEKKEEAKKQAKLEEYGTKYKELAEVRIRRDEAKKSR